MLHYHSKTISLCAFNNCDFHVGKWIDKHPDLNMFELTVAAMKENNKTIIDWFDFCGRVFEEKDMFIYACENGHIDILEIMRLWFSEELDYDLSSGFQPAVDKGQINVLDWLYTNTKIHPGSVVMNYENPSIEEWLRNHNIEINN